MNQYFAIDYQGPAFDLFGPGHLLALAIVGSIIAFLFWGWRDPTETGKERARWILVGAFLLVEVSYHGWLFYYDAWNVQTHLPLHLCSFSIWGSLYMLIARDYRPYEILYFFGLGGATQAILTPAAGDFGLPHFRAIQTLSSHSLVVITLIYLTVIVGLRPTWRSVIKAMIAINVLMVIVTCINLLIDGNYMYTLRKPDTASLFDLLGPWPWYLFWTEFLAFGLFALLYLPFALRDRIRAPAITRQRGES